MNAWLKGSLFAVLALFVALGVLFAARRDWDAAAGAGAISSLVAFVWAMGWFHFRFPLPPRPSRQPFSVFSELRRIRATYPGWPSAFATSVTALLVLALLGSQAVYWLRWFK